MAFAVISLLVGLVLLLWSADCFVEGAASAARHWGVSPLLVGILIVGLGTSSPEIVVSILSSIDGNTGIALGNAYGSNIANIALILGMAALIAPIAVRNTLLRKELPLLFVATILSFILLIDLNLSQWDSMVLLGSFLLFMGCTIYEGLRRKESELIQEENQDGGTSKKMSLNQSIFWLFFGLILLIVSSRMLVWGGVNIAQFFGVSDMVIGLTIIALGTSLPELASTVIAAKKSQHDIALGSVIGSNLFNTLAVVGIAGFIHPFTIDPETLSRDMAVMMGLTISLFFIGYGFKGRQGCISRFEGFLLLLSYLFYNIWLVSRTLF